MSRSIRSIRSDLCHDAEQRLAALLTAERSAGEPSDVDQQRVWGALQGRLVAVEAARPGTRGRRWRRGLVVAALVAGAGGLVGSGLGSEPAPVHAPVAIELPAVSRPRVLVPSERAMPSTPRATAVPVVETIADRPGPNDGTTPTPKRPRRRVTAAVPVEEPDATSTLADQLELIRAARQALEHGRASIALGHVERYRERFVDGLLVEEAEGIATAARCAQGEDAAATREAFTTRWPQSIHGKLVERFCRASPD